MEWVWQWSQDLQSLERAFEWAQKAIALDDSLPASHALLSVVFLFKKQHDQAIVEAKRAVALNPNGADGYLELGLILNYAGQPEEAIEMVEKAMRLNPRYPSDYLWILGAAYLLRERYEEAIAIQKQALNLNPNMLASHLALVVIYSELGRVEEVQAEVAEALRISPQLSLEVWRQRAPYKDPTVLERILAALRKAGLK